MKFGDVGSTAWAIVWRVRSAYLACNRSSVDALGVSSIHGVSLVINCSNASRCVMVCWFVSMVCSIGMCDFSVLAVRCFSIGFASLRMWSI